MTPILWSFRRCPYAMRARLGLASAGVKVELREIVLRDKPEAFLETSPSATVPCLKTGDVIIDESLDVMIWALQQNDPEGLMDMPQTGHDLIEANDTWFKHSLDRYKYGTRYAEADTQTERDKAGRFITQLNTALSNQDYLFGPKPSLADLAILPFVRQFAHVDLEWFAAQPWENATRWLERFKSSDRFISIMSKYPAWAEGDAPTAFP